MGWVICGAALIVCFWAKKEMRTHSTMYHDQTGAERMMMPSGLLSTKVWWVSAGVFIIALIASGMSIL